MDIHKPKPWHGLREFLKEYLIIVIGVLTALTFVREGQPSVASGLPGLALKRQRCADCVEKDGAPSGVQLGDGETAPAVRLASMVPRSRRQG